MANELKVDVSALERLPKKFAVFPRDLQKIMEATAKDTMQYVGNRIEKDIPKHFGMSQEGIRDAFRNKRRRRIVRTLKGAEMHFTVAGPRLNLARFNRYPLQTTPNFLPPERRKGYNYHTMIYRSRGLKQIHPILGEDGKPKPIFLMKVRRKANSMSGSTLPYIFMRRTGKFDSKGKEKIESRQGMGVNQMLESEPVWDKLNKDLTKYANRKIQSQVDKDMERIKKEIEAWR